jgi:hypothetical protein
MKASRRLRKAWKSTGFGRKATPGGRPPRSAISAGDSALVTMTGKCW